jgi:hypothetical protein
MPLNRWLACQIAGVEPINAIYAECQADKHSIPAHGTEGKKKARIL